MRKGKSFWKYAEEAGKRVCLINVPFTFPPEKVNGVVIAGMDTPSYDSDFMYPKELKDEIERHVGKYRVDTHISDIQGYESMEEHKLLDIFKKHVFEQIDIHAEQPFTSLKMKNGTFLPLSPLLPTGLSIITGNSIKMAKMLCQK